MAPFKAPPKTVWDAKKKGLVPMTDFFGPKVKRGRPQKAASKAGRLATKEVPPTAPGSTIEMSPSAFMTREAWLGMAEKRAKGMRSMPVIFDHPDWWALEVLDGAPMQETSGTGTKGRNGNALPCAAPWTV